MACFKPIQGFKGPDGQFLISRDARRGSLNHMAVPCGRCRGCRLEYSRQWAVRIMHEAQMHETNSFITLTYDQANLPPDGSLELEDWQKFLKRLRKKLGPTRFYHCGEYGDENDRPHFHAAIFGRDFTKDRIPYKNQLGNQTYTSETLTEIWGKGLAVIGDLTHESAAYIARYVIKKINGQMAESHYKRRIERIDEITGEVLEERDVQLKPEYCTMSRRPGIGKTWIERFHKDVYPRDEIIVNGHKARPPKFYDRYFEELDPTGHAAMKKSRSETACRYSADNTPERLATKERCLEAKHSRKKRDL